MTDPKKEHVKNLLGVYPIGVREEHCLIIKWLHLLEEIQQGISSFRLEGMEVIISKLDESISKIETRREETQQAMQNIVVPWVFGQDDDPNQPDPNDPNAPDPNDPNAQRTAEAAELTTEQIRDKINAIIEIIKRDQEYLKAIHGYTTIEEGEEHKMVPLIGRLVSEIEIIKDNHGAGAPFDRNRGNAIRDIKLIINEMRDLLKIDESTLSRREARMDRGLLGQNTKLESLELELTENIEKLSELLGKLLPKFTGADDVQHPIASIIRDKIGPLLQEITGKLTAINTKIKGTENVERALVVYTKDVFKHDAVLVKELKEIEEKIDEMERNAQNRALITAELTYITSLIAGDTTKPGLKDHLEGRQQKLVGKLRAIKQAEEELSELFELLNKEARADKGLHQLLRELITEIQREIDNSQPPQPEPAQQ